MTKEEFLKKLEQQLNLINDEERIDILSEYEQHIEMKITNGLSEEEAIEDFGDMDELVKEILEAYPHQYGLWQPRPPSQQDAGLLHPLRRRFSDAAGHHAPRDGSPPVGTAFH